MAAAAKPRVRVPAGSSVRPALSGPSNTLVRQRRPSTPFDAADPFEPAFAGSHASRGSADADWLPGRLEGIARIQNVINNDPLAASGKEQKQSLIVGDGWHYEAMPDPASFGLTPTDAAYDALTESLEAIWTEWAEDPLFRCDYEERLPFDLLLDLATGQYVGAEGEAFAMLPFVEDRDFWGTSLQVIDTARVDQPAGLPDSDEIRAGVRFDDRGRPVEYYVLDGHPWDIGLAGLNRFRGRWVPSRVPGMPTDTRPFMIHLMKHRRPGQTRGISDFVSSLPLLQYLRDLTRAELRQRMINALIVAQYTSQTNDPEALTEILGAENADQLLDLRAAYYDEAGLTRMGGSRIIQTFPGDELKWNSDVRSANEYADVAGFLGIQAGAGIGLGYSLMTRDFSKTTFSSARTEINDSVRMMRRERGIIRHLFVRPIRLALFQEAYEEGRIALPKGAPSIWDKPAAYLGGTDIGPGREYVDPVKEATGDRMEMENLSASPSDIAARRGQSLEEVAARWSRDKRVLERNGLKIGDLGSFVAAEQANRDPEPPAGN